MEQGELSEVLKMAEDGDVEAMVALAGLYLSGEDVEQDISKGLKYLKAAANDNNPTAQYFLAQLYLNGRYVLPDNSEGLKWLEMASINNDPDALNDLGVLYLGGNIVKEDQLKAFQYFQKAASLGNDNAESNLAACYLNGSGCITNPYKAVEYARRGAAKGIAQSQRILGYCYSSGIGVARNEQEGLELLYKASEQGDPGAEFFIGLYYADKNEKETAWSYLQRAADHGNEMAKTMLNEKKIEEQSGRGGGCYIATATYGSPLAAEVVVFRNYRDRYLSSSLVGRLFIRLYYVMSPSFALIIEKNEKLRVASLKILNKIMNHLPDDCYRI